ncbi:hypothetical protein D3C80_591400 [compost metagenome]
MRSPSLTPLLGTCTLAPFSNWVADPTAPSSSPVVSITFGGKRCPRTRSTLNDNGCEFTAQPWRAIWKNTSTSSPTLTSSDAGLTPNCMTPFGWLLASRRCTMTWRLSTVSPSQWQSTTSPASARTGHLAFITSPVLKASGSSTSPEKPTISMAGR